MSRRALRAAIGLAVAASAAALVACGGGGGNSSTVTSPQPPPPAPTALQQLGAQFVAAFRASNNAEPVEASTTDLSAPSLTTDPFEPTGA